MCFYNSRGNNEIKVNILRSNYLGLVWYTFFKNGFLVCKLENEVPLNFSLFDTSISNFDLKNILVFL